MPRPFPSMPRGPRRKRSAESRRQLLACPRIAPDWELAALRALMKPQARGPIEHRPAAQAWPTGTAQVIEYVVAAVREQIGYDARPHFPAGGDYHFVVDIAPTEATDARALAVALSARLPTLWFVLGPVYLRGGRFYRRQRGVKLKLVPATNIHLPRHLRAAISHLTRPCSVHRIASRPPTKRSLTSGHCN